MTEEQRQNEGQAAMRFVMEEAQSGWQVALAAGYKLDVLACHWLLIFAPESSVRLINNGLPLGQVLDLMRDRGHRLPPEIEPVHAAWYAKIVAADLERHWSERLTPEGREAAVGDRKAERLQFRRARAKHKKIMAQLNATNESIHHRQT